MSPENVQMPPSVEDARAAIAWLDQYGSAPGEGHRRAEIVRQFARTHECSCAAKPQTANDVVGSSTAARLPAGSIIVREVDGVVEPGAVAITITDDIHRDAASVDGPWIVLHKAAPEPIEVGDVVPGWRANQDLPNLSIVLSVNNEGAPAYGFPMIRVNGRWVNHEHDRAPDLLVNGGRFRVLHVPGGVS